MFYEFTLFLWQKRKKERKYKRKIMRDQRNFFFFFFEVWLNLLARLIEIKGWIGHSSRSEQIVTRWENDSQVDRREVTSSWNALLAFFPTVPSPSSFVAVSIGANLSTYAHTNATRESARCSTLCRGRDAIVPRASREFRHSLCFAPCTKSTRTIRTKENHSFFNYSLTPLVVSVSLPFSFRVSNLCLFLYDNI